MNTPTLEFVDVEKPEIVKLEFNRKIEFFKQYRRVNYDCRKAQWGRKRFYNKLEYVFLTIWGRKPQFREITELLDSVIKY